MTELLSMSLRDRKRAETWSDIHDAAARMTLERGYVHVTVEEIAAQANVSPRTFFNYFTTKDDAILGLSEPTLDGQVDLSGTDDVFAQVTRLLREAVQSTISGDFDTSLRFEVLEKYPELMGRRRASFAKAETLVRDALLEALDGDAGTRLAPEGVTPAELSQVLVLIGGAVMRYAFQPGPHNGVDEHTAAVDDATTLFRKVLRKDQ